MEDELKSIKHNEVWELIELPEGYKQVGCKWIFKTKHDSNGNIERYKATHLLLKVLLRRMASITMKHFHLFHEKIHLL
ncbi:unnamed protein product [Rhodiola kirilowii]